MVYIESNLIQSSHNNWLKWIIFDSIETIKVSNKPLVRFSENLQREVLYTCSKSRGDNACGIYELGRN